MVSQNVYIFSISESAIDVLVDNMSNRSSGHDISKFMLCSKSAESLGESAQAIGVLNLHIYYAYTNKILFILVQIQHESIFSEDSAGQRAGPGLTST